MIKRMKANFIVIPSFISGIVEKLDGIICVIKPIKKDLCIMQNYFYFVFSGDDVLCRGLKKKVLIAVNNAITVHYL
ncbi:MAG: hypothetical protein COV35_03755 [Alphaproteobacteria bacterium CG11_big_fil_rev_8_21_14_0_20_39_49]|nr:MAG: hypothetical protein COV35_03755 [Alphaproteobacteria bacterium CG11_big_fil_rev_8_21_14_0_20_39_49]